MHLNIYKTKVFMNISFHVARKIKEEKLFSILVIITWQVYTIAKPSQAINKYSYYSFELIFITK